MQLLIGNKNYSSWSMRPWVLMTHFGIRFDETLIRFDDMAADSAFKRRVLAVSPAGRVPVLIDGDLVVWDSLAIAEYLAERFPSLALWPVEIERRARARSLCAEMHSGLSALRQHFPMNIEAELHAVGARVLAQQPAARDDLDRVIQMWGQALNDSGGPFLFGPFGIVDAFFAPVTYRISGYGLPVPPHIAAYVQRVQASPGVRAWVAQALEEHQFVPVDEPYRTAPT